MWHPFFTFTSGGEVAVPPVAATAGGWLPYVHLRFKLDEEDDKKEATEEIVNQVAEGITPDTTAIDLEIALRMRLQQQDIDFRTLYLTWVQQELERIRRHEADMEEEVAVMMMMAY